MVGENPSVDYFCLKYLEDHMKKKYVNKALVLYKSGHTKGEMNIAHNDRIRFAEISEKTLNRIYEVYCFYKYFDNIVFSYVDKPIDNHLGRYIRESTVNEEDASCLALFHLRHIPTCVKGRD